MYTLIFFRFEYNNFHYVRCLFSLQFPLPAAATMAAAAAQREFHEQQRVWCVLQLSQGKTFPQICQQFVAKYANAGPGFKREPPSARRTVVRYSVN